MNELEINNDLDWRSSHLKSIFLNYKKAPRFEECFTKLESLYAIEHVLLVDLCLDHLKFWLDELGIQTRIIKLSDLSISGKKSDLILNICKYTGAHKYISGALGKDYLNIPSFHECGIELEFQQYRNPVYSQLWGEFKPYLSIVDFWMNTDQFELIWREC
ncbi:WbqC-like protein family protein [compost metagenome]